MNLEYLPKLPGFIYQIGQKYYYLGKWICKECADTDATDCVTMYHMCKNAGEQAETGMYFQKIRAYSDFALEVPYNPSKIKEDLAALLERLTPEEREYLNAQVEKVREEIPC